MRQELKEALSKLAKTMMEIGGQLYYEPTDDRDLERLHMLHGLELRGAAAMVRDWIEEIEASEKDCPCVNWAWSDTGVDPLSCKHHQNCPKA